MLVIGLVEVGGCLIILHISVEATVGCFSCSCLENVECDACIYENSVS